MAKASTFRLAVIPFVYLESWMFDVPGVALGWITVINTILVMFPFSIVFIFEAMNDQVTRDILDNVFLIFPQYDISMGLFSAFMREGLQSKWDHIRVCQVMLGIYHCKHWDVY